MQRLRVALIGCGAVARRHAGSLGALREVEIVALVDPSAANIELMRAAHPWLDNAPAFSNTQDLYRSVALHAVEILTPHSLHAPQIMEALDNGLHVLCEKPLVASIEEARAIVARAAAVGTVVTIAYQRRVDPAYLYMRQAITSGEVGDLRTIAILGAQDWHRLTAGTWRQDPSTAGGGMLMDTGSHLVDVLLWLVDQAPRSVAALVDGLDAPVDLNSVVTIGFTGGVQAQLTVIGRLPANWIETVLVAGERGVLRYENEPQHPWRTGRVLHYRDGAIVQPLNLAAATSPDAAWVEAIFGRAPNPAPPEVGLRVAELTQTIYRAAREGSTVFLS